MTAPVGVLPAPPEGRPGVEARAVAGTTDLVAGERIALTNEHGLSVVESGEAPTETVSEWVTVRGALMRDVVSAARNPLCCRPTLLWFPHAPNLPRAEATPVTADLLLLAGIGVLALPMAWWLRPGTVLAISVAVGVAQVYVTRSLDVPAAVVWQIAAAATVFRHRQHLPRPRVAAWAFACYLALSLAALLWSPDPMSGLTLCAQLLGLGVLVALAMIVRRRGEFGLPLGVLAVVVVISGISIVAFRVAPSLENGYFTSPWFGLFDGHVLASDFFTSQRNNALDRVKAGGLFFVNANAASLFCGASAAVLLGGALLAGPRVRKVAYGVVAIDVCALSATGSKTGLYLTVLMAVLVIIASAFSARRRPGLFAAVTSVAVAVAVAVAFVLPAAFGVVARAQASALAESIEPASPASASSVESPGGRAPAAGEQRLAPINAAQPGLVDQSTGAIDSRMEIWRAAAVIFEEQPIGGFGFGGWHQRFAALAEKDGINATFPPHNWVLQAWADTGALSVVLLAVMIGSMVWNAVRTRRRGVHLRRAATVELCFGAALLWTLLHGLGDNTGVYGGPRLLVVTAMAVAWAVDNAFVVVRPRRRRSIAAPAQVDVPSSEFCASEQAERVLRPVDHVVPVGRGPGLRQA